MHYKILQLSDLTAYGFMNYEFAKKHGFNLADYHVVYEGKIDGDKDNIDEVLEDLFYIFNVNHPLDFKGHSLSVSDIVEVNGVSYYCDSTGWVRL